MAIRFLIFTLPFILTGRLFSQDVSAEDYQLYSIIIQKETNPTAKSICVIKYAAESMKDYKYNSLDPLQWQEIKRQNKNPLFLLQNQATDSMDQPRRIFDDTLKRFIDKYYEKDQGKFILQNSFSLPYDVFLLKKMPTKGKSVEKNWKWFYEKYPASGGIFAFSNIIYSENKHLAIFYYWIKRNGLNGHGEIVIMHKTNDTWNIFTKINLWYN